MLLLALMENKVEALRIPFDMDAFRAEMNIAIVAQSNKKN